MPGDPVMDAFDLADGVAPQADPIAEAFDLSDRNAAYTPAGSLDGWQPDDREAVARGVIPGASPALGGTGIVAGAPRRPGTGWTGLDTAVAVAGSYPGAVVDSAASAAGLVGGAFNRAYQGVAGATVDGLRWLESKRPLPGVQPDPRTRYDASTPEGAAMLRQTLGAPAMAPQAMASPLQGGSALPPQMGPTAQPQYQNQGDPYGLPGLNPVQRILIGQDPQVEEVAKTIGPDMLADFRRNVAEGGGDLSNRNDDQVRRLIAMRHVYPNGIAQTAGPETQPGQTFGGAVSDFARGLPQGAVAQPMAGVSGALASMAELAGEPPTGLPAEFRRNEARIQRENAPTGWWNQAGQTIGQVAPMGMAAASGAALPAEALTFLMATQGYASGVQDYRRSKAEQGLPIDDQEASLVGLAYGAIEQVTEKMGLDEVTKRLPQFLASAKAFKGAPNARTALAVLQAATIPPAIEGVEEGLSQLGTNTVAKAAYDPGRPFTEQVPESIGWGAVGGMAFSGPAALQAGVSMHQQGQAEKARASAAQFRETMQGISDAKNAVAPGQDGRQDSGLRYAKPGTFGRPAGPGQQGAPGTPADNEVVRQYFADHPEEIQKVAESDDPAAALREIIANAPARTGAPESRIRTNPDGTTTPEYRFSDLRGPAQPGQMAADADTIGESKPAAPMLPGQVAGAYEDARRSTKPVKINTPKTLLQDLLGPPDNAAEQTRRFREQQAFDAAREEERRGYMALAGDQDQARSNADFLAENQGVERPGSVSGDQPAVPEQGLEARMRAMPLDDLRTLSERLTGFRTGARPALMMRVRRAVAEGKTANGRQDTANRGGERAPGAWPEIYGQTERARPQAPAPKPIDPRWNPNVADWVNEGMIAEGKNPNRILNDIDAQRPQTVEQLKNDPIAAFLKETDPAMHERLLRGDLTAKEYAAAMKAKREAERARPVSPGVPTQETTDVQQEEGQGRQGLRPLNPNGSEIPNGSPAPAAGDSVDAAVSKIRSAKDRAGWVSGLVDLAQSMPDGTSIADDATGVTWTRKREVNQRGTETISFTSDGGRGEADFAFQRKPGGEWSVLGEPVFGPETRVTTNQSAPNSPAKPDSSPSARIGPTTDKAVPASEAKPPVVKPSLTPDQSPDAGKKVEGGGRNFPPAIKKPVQPDFESQAPDEQDPANMVSKSGRKLAPHPDGKVDTERRANAEIKKSNIWLATEAAKEAESVGDEYNARIFRRDIEDAAKGNMPPASVDAAHLYLFGRDQIRFKRPDKSQPPQKPVTPPVAPSPRPGKQSAPSDGAQSSERAGAVDYKSMSIPEIRELAQTRGIDPTGAKSAVMRRLMEDDAKPEAERGPKYKGIPLAKPAKDLTDEEWAKIQEPAGEPMKDRNRELGTYSGDVRFLRLITKGEIGYQPSLSDAQQPVTLDYNAVRAYLRDGTMTERGKLVESVLAEWIAESKRINPDADVGPEQTKHIRDKTVWLIISAIERGRFSNALHPQNKVSRAVFQKLTGVKLPKTLRDTEAMFTGKPFPMVGAEKAAAKTPPSPVKPFAPPGFVAAVTPYQIKDGRWRVKVPHNSEGRQPTDYPAFDAQDAEDAIQSAWVDAGEWWRQERGEDGVEQNQAAKAPVPARPFSVAGSIARGLRDLAFKPGTREGALMREWAEHFEKAPDAKVPELVEDLRTVIGGKENRHTSPFGVAASDEIAAMLDANASRLPAKAPEPKRAPVELDTDRVTTFTPGQDVYLPTDDPNGPHGETFLARVEAVKTMFGKPHVKFERAPKWKPVDEVVAYTRRPEVVKTEKPAATPAAPAPSVLSPERQARKAELEKRLRDKIQNRLTMGFDPVMLAEATELASIYIEEGAKKFAAFARQMVGTLGDAVRPYLKSLYNGARDLPGMEEHADGMDAAADVSKLKAADIDALLSEQGDGDGEVPNDGRDGRDAAGSEPVLPGPAGADQGDAGAGGNADAQGEPVGAEPPAGDGQPERESGAQGDADGVVAAGGRRGGSRGGRRGGKRGGTQPGTEADGTPVEPGPVGEDPKVHDLDAPATKDVRDLNHRIAADDVIAPPSQAGKIKGNIKAIRTLKLLEKEDRNPTPEEKKTLAQYVGFGPIGEVVNRLKAEVWERYLERKASGYGYVYEPDDDVKSWAKNYYEDYKTLREMVDRTEFEAITKSTRNAHYTGKNVIERGIWPAVQRLGFTGGNVLETSAGIGHMIGLMPEALAPTSKWTAVELDSISARILTKLYPQANVLNSPFQEAPLKKHVFDLIVGNVPFASDKVKTDEGYPSFSLHNYFLAKSIDMLRPGGLMVAISSISSMDADASRTWREWMAERADLVGAIRLPNNAFIKSANTAVTTDMLIFRKKQQGHPLEKVQDFAYTVQLDTKEKGKQGGKLDPIPLNVYYENNPAMLLGKMSAKGEMYGGINSDKSEPTMDPTPGALEEKIDAAVQALPANVLRLGNHVEAEVVDAAPGTRMYALFTDKAGNVMRRTPDGSVVLKGAEAKAAKAFMGLRDAMAGVVSRQVDENATDADLDLARKALKEQYEKFVEKYGRINEKKSSIPESVEDDPDFNKVAALEMVTYKGVQRGTTKTGKPRYVLLPIISPADILTKRTQWPFKEPETADTPRDAIAISEFFRGALNLPYVAKLLGKSEADARKAILAERLVFLDPASGEMVPTAAYLSGNIKTKLAEAEKAAKTDATYSLNVEALTPLIPQPVPVSKINMRMGSTWIPEKAYTAFVESLFGKGTVSIIKTSTGQWSVKTMEYAADADGRVNLSRYGKHEFTALDIVKSILEVEPLIAYDTVQTDSGGTSKRKNPERSADAQLMADAIREKFVEWAKSGDMAASIADAYNETYNASLPRKYEPPPYKHFPGASQAITLRDYQKRGVMRGIAGSYLNAAEVGLGKTFIGISTAMEWRRLKQARKPLLVVQPATLMQVSTAFNQLYPTANVLVPTEAERKKENWPRLINRITTGDWDCIVIPQTLFNNIRTSPAFAAAFIHGEIDALTQAAADAIENDGKRSTTAKKLQEQIDALEKYLENIRKAATEDKGALFLDQLGIDGLIVDEAHDYKNSYFRTAYTQLKGVNPNASGRALDMLLKTKYVQQRVGMGRNIVLMTGTPVSNTIGEAWVMMRYVRPDLLEANHLTNFDDFAGAFADISAKEEMDATNRFKPQLRMRAFTNTKQFQSIWLDVVDSVRYDNLPEAERKTINRPGIKGGKPTMIEMQPTKETLRIMRGLIARYEWFENLRGKERFQNRHVPGVINTKARKASIDPRMINASLPDDPGSKVNRLVSEVYDRWKAGEDYQTAQVIFSDLYRDNPDDPRFNVFEDIQAKLIARGVPAGEIVIATDLTDAGRAAVFERVNSGGVRVIMGTTQKLGIGVNIQQRLAALHHLDAPYRPMDMEQREGRIIRFGNLVPSLTGSDPEILRYGVQKTFDAGQYGRLERKQRAVNDTLAGNVVDDTVEGAGEETALSFAEASAAFSGDPDVMRKVELDGDVRRLEGLRASFVDAREDTVRRIEQARYWKAHNLTSAAKSEAWIKKHGATLDLDAAEYGVPGTDGKLTGDAAKKALTEWFKSTIERTKTRGEEGTAPRIKEGAGTLRINGLDFQTTSYADLSGEQGYVPGNSGISASLDSLGELSTGNYRTPAGLLSRIKEGWDGIEAKIEQGRRGAEKNEDEATKFEEALKKLKFDQQQELDDLKAEREKVMARLRAKKEAEQTAGAADVDPNDPHAGEMEDIDPIDDGDGDFRNKTANPDPKVPGGLTPLSKTRAAPNMGMDAVRSAPDSAFVTDGRAMIHTAWLSAEQAQAAKGLEAADRRDLTEESCRKVWETMRTTTVPATILGTIERGKKKDAQTYAIADDGTRVAAFLASRVKSMTAALGITGYKLSPGDGQNSLIFVRGDADVAILMPVQVQGLDRADFVTDGGDADAPDLKGMSIPDLRTEAERRGVKSTGAIGTVRKRLENNLLAEQDAQGLQAAMREALGPDIAVEAVEPADGLESDLATFLERMGQTPVFLQIDGTEAVEGIVLGRLRERIYLAAGQDPVRLAQNALHELMHSSRAQNPDLHRVLSRTLGEQRIAAAAAEYRRDLVSQFGEGSKPVGFFDEDADAQQDEGIARAVESMANDPEVRAAMLARPGLWARIKRWVRSMLEKAGFGSDTDRLRTAVLEVLDGMEKGGHVYGGAEEGVRFSVAPPTQSTAFRAWFKDSKVVDGDGKPLVVFHGAPDVRGVFAEGFKARSRGQVWFAAADRSVADSYADDRRAFDYQNAEPQTIPLYLAITNPMVVDAKGKHWRDTERHVQEAKDAGHDGIIIKNSVDYYLSEQGKTGKPTTVYAWFTPTQAKSAVSEQLKSRVDGKPIAGATGNTGTYDPKNPDIRYSVKPGPVKKAEAGPITEAIFAGTLAAKRALDAKVSKGKKLTDIVRAIQADPKTDPALRGDANTKRIQRIARAMLADAGPNGANWAKAVEGSVAEYHRQRQIKTDAAVAKKFKSKDAEGLTAKLEAAQKRAGQMSEVEQRAFEEGRTEANKRVSNTERVVRAEMGKQIRDNMRETQAWLADAARDIYRGRKAERAIGAFEQRSAVEGAKATEQAKQRVADGYRAELVRLLEDNMPRALRAKYLVAVKNTKTPAALVGQMNRMRRDLVRWDARIQIMQARKAMQPGIAFLEPAVQTDVRAAIAQIARSRGVLWPKKAAGAKGRVPIETLMLAREELRDAANLIVSAFHEQKTLDTIRIGAEAVDAAQKRRQIIDAQASRKHLEEQGTRGNREAGPMARMMRRRTNWEQLSRLIDGFKRGGAAVQLFNDVLRGRRLATAMHQKFSDAFAKIVQDNGYKDLGAFLAEVSGSLGPAGQKSIDVKFGPHKSLTLGQALYVYASSKDEGFRARVLPTYDDNGMVKKRGQTLQFREADQEQPFSITNDDLDRVARAIPANLRRIVDEGKALYDASFFEQLSRVNKRLKGYFLEKVEGYWGIKILRKAGPDRGTPSNWKGSAIRALENAGYMQERTGASKAPISIGDFGVDILLRSRSAAHLVHKAERVKAMVRVLLHADPANPSENVVAAITKTLGAETITRLEKRIAAWSEGDSGIQADKGFRRLLSLWARSKTQLWVPTWLRNASGAAKLLNDHSLAGFASGLSGITPGAYADLRKHSPELRERWDGGGLGAFQTDTATHVGHAGITDAAKMTLRNLAGIAKTAANRNGVSRGDMLRGVGKAWNSTLDAISIGNFFDAIPAMIAYRAFLKKAPKNLDAEGKKAWAARHATRSFERIANTSNTEYANDIQLAARDSVMLASFIPFTGDIAKTQTMLYEAWSKKGMKPVIRMALATAFASSLSAMVAALVTGLRGDDEEKVKQAAARRFLDEISSILPGGSIARQTINAWRSESPSASVLDTAFGDLLSQAVAVVKDVNRAIDRADKPLKRRMLTATDLYSRAIWRAVDLGGDLSGLPIGQYRRFTEKAIEQWSE